jgi:4'-phosphopantetheinyl transferase
MREMELWLVDLQSSAAALEHVEAATPRLSHACQCQLAAMAMADARRDRRLTHIALRIALERKLGPGVRGVAFARSASGEPSLPDRGANFSIAHTHGLALIAISDVGPIGIDVEKSRIVRMPAMRRAPIEAEAIRLAAGAPLGGSDDADARFLRAWVRMEAVAKARGTGVGPLLETVRPRGATSAAPGLDVALPDGGTAVMAHDLSTAPGTFAAVAFSGLQPPPPLVRFPVDAEAIEALARSR